MFSTKMASFLMVALFACLRCFWTSSLSGLGMLWGCGIAPSVHDLGAAPLCERRCRGLAVVGAKTEALFRSFKSAIFLHFCGLRRSV
jgi:hypothetical protein